MSRVYYVTLLAALVLALLAPLSLAGAQPPPPLPARLLMEPPTQAELDAQASLLPAGVAPLIRGAVFYDQDGDAQPRVARNVTVGSATSRSPSTRTRASSASTNPASTPWSARPSPTSSATTCSRRCPRPPTTWCCWTWRIPTCRPARWPPRPTRSPWRWRPARARPLTWACGCARPPPSATSCSRRSPGPAHRRRHSPRWPGFDPETASDEWLELRNTTGRTIDLTGWTLTAADGTPNIALRGRIPPHGSYLLERSDDGSVPPALVDQIYPGALENTGEDLTLSDGVTPIDRVDAWYAGDTAFHTMQRVTSPCRAPTPPPGPTGRSTARRRTAWSTPTPTPTSSRPTRARPRSRSTATTGMPASIRARPRSSTWSTRTATTRWTKG